MKAAIRCFATNDGFNDLTQRLLTLAVIAKNLAPHAVTGLPPAFAMAGRCDIVSGAATCTWENDPLSHDSLIRQMKDVRKIIEARNAIMQKDAERAVKISLNHQLPGGRGAFFLDWVIGSNRYWQGMGRGIQSHRPLSRKPPSGTRQ